ncbi:MAG: VTT domain-containing protein [Bacteroidota bacterium]
MLLLFKILKENSISTFYLVGLLAISITLSIVLGSSAYYYAREFADTPNSVIFIFYFFSVFSMAFGLTSTTFISIISGYILQWHSIYPLVVAYMLASIFGYFIAKKIDKGKFLASIQKNEKLGKIYKRLNYQSFYATIFTKISPFIPFAVGNFLLSISNVRITYFLVGSFLGMLPRTLIAIWTGIQLNHIINPTENQAFNTWVNWMIMGLVGISLLGFYYVFRDNKKA